ncbi:MAG: type II secretion system protein GspG [Spirochaetota bacterium]
MKYTQLLAPIISIRKLLYPLAFLVFIVGNLHATGYCPIEKKLKNNQLRILFLLKEYAIAYGQFPSEEQGLIALYEKPTVGDIPQNYKPLARGKYAITDPWGELYILKYDTVTEEPRILTYGMDKQPGGIGKCLDLDLSKPIPQEFIDDETKCGKETVWEMLGRYAWKAIRIPLLMLLFLIELVYHIIFETKLFP